ncbi:hypothetical protein [Dactylosporangium sp. CA-092794]|uniref:hypothetical protein n=1 Tax=Dactylosporangium sp. CA-092794 TaxID=3239929 RepID=UPI003D8EFD84
MAAVVEVELDAERTWWKAERQALADRADALGLTAAERAQLADALQARHEQLRAAGELRGTRTAVVLPALRQLLDERGWSARRWRPVPPTRRGRPWGTHDEAFEARVNLYLPDALGETLARACHWTSAPAVAALQKWYDQHGDHWRGQLHNHGTRWAGAGPSHADLAARDQLVKGIQTTGKVLREAISRALAEAKR